LLPPLSPDFDLKTTVSEISVFFDSQSNKHRLTVTFSEYVSQCLRAIEQATQQLTAESFGSSCESFNFTDHFHRTVGNSLRSQSQSEKDQSGLVDDGGINEVSQLSQNPCKARQSAAVWTSRLLTLAIPPLSAYQQQLIDAIERLRNSGWTDRQIAKYFNDRSMMTPRGKQWIAQSVFSMRMKYERRLARVGGSW